MSAQATYTRPRTSLSLLYFGGAERPRGAVEGQRWRHLFDAHVTWHVAPWLSLLAHGNAGFEPTRIEHAFWLAGALYARARVIDRLFVALRGDGFHEHVPRGASAIFWPVSWVSSSTATLDYRPAEQVSMRLEYRVDHAAGAMYFGGRVSSDHDTMAYLPNRRTQNTVTVGLTAWF